MTNCAGLWENKHGLFKIIFSDYYVVFDVIKERAPCIKIIFDSIETG